MDVGAARVAAASTVCRMRSAVPHERVAFGRTTSFLRRNFNEVLSGEGPKFQFAFGSPKVGVAIFAPVR